MDRIKDKKQDEKERIRNFDEVAFGYTEKEAFAEASRCLQCKKSPCVKGCPVEIDIPGFIKKVREKDIKGAAEVIYEKNMLPSICGRVCPQETQCEVACVLARKGSPVSIGKLERFVGDLGYQSFACAYTGKEKNKKKVSVIGSGPAGLTCAAELAKCGISVTVFESLHVPGGVLVYGIPEFRLPKNVVTREINLLKKLGVEIKTDIIVGRTITLDEIFEMGYSAVFIGSGAGLPSFMGIPGENLLRVYSANEFLTRVNLMKGYLFPDYDTPVSTGETVAVVGGGNVAMDSARASLRLGAKQVNVLYRRTEKEMPARLEEYENAREEGIVFRFLVQPLEILGNEEGYVKGIKVIHNRLGEPDESGRRSPVNIKGTEEIIGADSVIVAIGQNPSPLIPSTYRKLSTGRKGNILVNEKTCETNIPGIFAGGDIATGAATVISAMGMGKTAAKSIVEYLAEKQI
ncbi:MAG TPA: NADPH-dependent glutamate synthase [bacterium]|nr:NADPH-dependent glutamate synthase [bacterium]